MRDKLLPALAALLVVSACDLPVVEVVPDEAATSRARQLAVGLDGICVIDEHDELICSGGYNRGGGLERPMHHLALGPAASVAMGGALRAVTRDGAVYRFYTPTKMSRTASHEQILEYSRPVRVDVEGAVATTGGDDHGCALLEGGRLACWWAETSDAIRNLALDLPTEPTLVPLEGVVLVDAGAFPCAVTGDGAAYCWAYELVVTGERVEQPRRLPVDAIVALSVGSGRVAVVDASGRVFVWLRFDGSIVEVPAPAGAVSIAASRSNACVATDGRELYCWGANSLGELGLGDQEPRDAPERVALDDVIAVDMAPGYISRTCALTGGGDVFCWGPPNANYDPRDDPLPLSPERVLW